jgi:WD40 repeat protein
MSAHFLLEGAEMVDNAQAGQKTSGREMALSAGLSLITICCYLVVLTPVLFFEELRAYCADRPYSISACHIVDGGRIAVLCFWSPAATAEKAPRRYVATIDLESDALRVHSVQPSKDKWLTASEIPGRQMVAVNFSGELTHIPLGPRKAGKALMTLFDGLRLNQLQSVNHQFVAALIAFELSVWDLERQKRVWSLTGEDVNALVAVPSRESVVALLSDGRIMEFAARTGELVRDTTHLPSPGGAVSISRDGRQLAVVTRTPGVRILSLPTERGPWTDVLPEAPGIPAGSMNISLSPDGEYLVTSPQQVSSRLTLWRVSTRQCFQTLESDARIIQGVAFSSESELLAWSYGGHLYRWDLRRGTEEVWTPRAATQRTSILSSLWSKSAPFARS